MNVKHHLDEATLVSYAAGSMSQAMALVVACHLTMCPTCRQRVKSSEAIGGMLLESLQPANIQPNALDSVLASLDDAPIKVEIAPRKYPVKKDMSHHAVPLPLQDYIGDSLECIEWRTIVPGVYYHDLPCKSERGGVSRLLRISPGKAMLPHSHDGNELTLILQGSFSDEVGRFTAGDIADLDDDIEHQPLVDSEVDCICLIATEAPLKFSTLLGRIVQPMTGF